MFPDSKDEKQNPVILAVLLFFLSIVFLALGAKNLYSIFTIFYLNPQVSEATILQVERNKWPRHRTFVYELEFQHPTEGTVKSQVVSSQAFEADSKIEVIYSKPHPKNAMINDSFLKNASNSFGTLALGFFVALFGTGQLGATAKRRQLQNTSSPESSATPATPPQTPLALKLFQFICVLGLFASIIGYLTGGNA